MHSRLTSQPISLSKTMSSSPTFPDHRVFKLSDDLAKFMGKPEATKEACVKKIMKQGALMPKSSKTPAAIEEITDMNDFMCDNGYGEYSEDVIAGLLERHFKPLDEIRKQSGLRKLVDAKTLTDVTFVCADGVCLPSYKLLISSKSEVFLAMFEKPGFVEAEKNTVNLPDVSSEVMRHFLEYLESEEIDEKKLLRPIVKEIFELAHKYDVKALETFCQEMMFRDEDPQNCADNVRIAYTFYKNQRMLEGARRVFKAKKKEVMESDGWKRLKMEEPEVVLEFVTDMI